MRTERSRNTARQSWRQTKPNSLSRRRKISLVYHMHETYTALPWALHFICVLRVLILMFVHYMNSWYAFYHRHVNNTRTAYTLFNSTLCICSNQLCQIKSCWTLSVSCFLNNWWGPHFDASDVFLRRSQKQRCGEWRVVKKQHSKRPSISNSSGDREESWTDWCRRWLKVPDFE